MGTSPWIGHWRLYLNPSGSSLSLNGASQEKEIHRLRGSWPRGLLCSQDPAFFSHLSLSPAADGAPSPPSTPPADLREGPKALVGGGGLFCLAASLGLLDWSKLDKQVTPTTLGV